MLKQKILLSYSCRVNNDQLSNTVQTITQITYIIYIPRSLLSKTVNNNNNNNNKGISAWTTTPLCHICTISINKDLSTYNLLFEFKKVT